MITLYIKEHFLNIFSKICQTLKYASSNENLSLSIWHIKHTKSLIVNNIELQHLKCFPENSTINLIVNLAFSKCLFELIWYLREFMTDICLRFGCWNKTPRLSSFKTTEIHFLPFWSLDSLRARHQHGSVVVKTPAGSQPVPSCSVFTWWQGLCRVSFVRVLIPFDRALPSRPKHLPKIHLLIPSPWALGFQSVNRGEKKNSDHLDMLAGYYSILSKISLLR